MFVWSLNLTRTILCLFLTFLFIPSVFAGGAGAGFGDYGDFGVSEGARMGANAHYLGLIPGNISATSSTPRVMTPLPTATPKPTVTQAPAYQNKTTTNATTEGNLTNSSIVADNFTSSSTNNSEPTLGDLIRAGDWNAITAYHDQKRTEQTNFHDTTGVNKSQGEAKIQDTTKTKNQNDSALASDDDSVVTVVYPCT